MNYFSSGLARIELATRGFGDHRSTSELQPYIFFVQPISLILCLKHDISSKELIFDLALLLRGSLHWEVVYPSNSNLLNWVEVSKSDLLSSRCIFLVNKSTIVFVSVALSFELSLSSIREMSPVFQCQDFPNFSYLKLCALIERYVIYRNQIFFQVHSLSFWALAKNLFYYFCSPLLKGDTALAERIFDGLCLKIFHHYVVPLLSKRRTIYFILLFFLFIEFLSIKYDLHKLMHLCLQVLELYQIGQVLLSSGMERYIYYCFVSKVYWKSPWSVSFS